MATPKITREQLLIEVSKLRDSHSKYVSADVIRRKEFAIAFGWLMPQSMYSINGNVPDAPSWEQIFVQVGRLLVLEELKKKIVPFSL